MKAMTNVLAYFTELLAAEDENTQQDQGPLMTELRHGYVCNQLRRNMVGTVLDFGCGTGQIFDNPGFPSVASLVYHGADVIAERRDLFVQRREGKATGGFFHVTQAIPYLDEMVSLARLSGADTIVLCGVMGYEGFTSLPEVMAALQRTGATRAIVTLPIAAQNYEERAIIRFEPVEALKYGELEYLHDGLAGLFVRF